MSAFIRYIPVSLGGGGSGSGSGVSTVGTFDSLPASVDGLVINGTVIYAQSASVTDPGMVNTLTQTFTGAKTFDTSLTTPQLALTPATRSSPSIVNNSLAGNVMIQTQTQDGLETPQLVVSGQEDAWATQLYCTYLQANQPQNVTTNLVIAGGTDSSSANTNPLNRLLISSRAFQVSDGKYQTVPDPTHLCSFINNTAANSVLSVVGASGQLGHLQDWSDNTGTPLAYVTGAGFINAPVVTATDFISASANPASFGVLSLANNEGIGWRNSTNNGNNSLIFNSSNVFAFDAPVTSTGNITATNSQLISTIATGTAPLVVSSTTQVANLNAATAGSAGTATVATTVATTATNSTNASFFPTFVASSTGSNQGIDTATGLSFNPSTNNLTTTTFTGSLSGNATSATTATTATNATNVATTQVSTNASFFPLMVSSSTNGNQAADLSTGLSHNPSTNILSTTGLNLSGLTASQAVVTDSSKNLASLGYATAATATTLAERDSSANLTANNHIEAYTTTATAGSTTTLTIGSTYIQYFTGSTTQTVVLPVVSTLVNGFQFLITNTSSSVVTVQTSGSNTVQAMAANTQLALTCINTAGGTGTASWNWTYTATNAALASGTVTSVTFTGDGTVLSSTPSSAVTTTGTVTGSLKTQTARTFLQGPLSGSAATPTFAALTARTTQVLTSGSSATYTTPTSPVPLYLRVTCIGGGGGGGGGDNVSGGAGGGGGGGGGTAIKIIANPTTTYTYTVGATANGGSAGNPGSAGTAGNASSFSTLTANGGTAGSGGASVSSAGPGGAGGTASGGDINLQGTGGTAGVPGLGGVTQGIGGTGGGSSLGGGGVGLGGNSTGGAGGTNTGGGGAGGSGTGGAGAAGIIIVEEFYQ